MHYTLHKRKCIHFYYIYTYFSLMYAPYTIQKKVYSVLSLDGESDAILLCCFFAPKTNNARPKYVIVFESKYDFQ